MMGRGSGSCCGYRGHESRRLSRPRGAPKLFADHVQVRKPVLLTVAPLDPQHPMLLLIFDPDCVHTRRVAPLWSSWLASGEAEGLTVLAIAPAPVAVAAEYARNQQWWVGVAAAVGSEEQPGGHRVTRRTPWVVAVDASGRVVREAHGAKLAEVAHELLDTR